MRGHIAGRHVSPVGQRRPERASLEAAPLLENHEDHQEHKEETVFSASFDDTFVFFVPFLFLRAYRYIEGEPSPKTNRQHNPQRAHALRRRADLRDLLSAEPLKETFSHKP